MLETKDLILDKAKPDDWQAMYRNVWSHPESTRYTVWSVTEREEDAPDRMRRTIQFQKNHDTYLVYLKASGEAIGFAGVEQMSSTVWEEAGICLGPDFMGKGYGTQILRCLIQYAKELGAKEFIASAWEQNQASRALITSLGFTQFDAEERTDERNGSPYTYLRYKLSL